MNEEPKTVKYMGIDSWSRPIFKGDDGRFYGSVNILFSYGATKKEVLNLVKADDLSYFGRKFDCEPDGTPCNVIIRGQE